MFVKDDFLAAVSHEIRTPLNAIVGWSHVLRGILVGAGAAVTGGIEAIERNARVLTRLISDLLDVSRIAAGNLAMDLEWFDPNGAVEAAVAALMPPAQARGVLIWDLGASPKSVCPYSSCRPPSPAPVLHNPVYCTGDYSSLLMCASVDAGVRVRRRHGSRSNRPDRPAVGQPP